MRYRGSSLIRNTPLLGPYVWTILGSFGGRGRGRGKGRGGGRARGRGRVNNEACLPIFKKPPRLEPCSTSLIPPVIIGTGVTRS